ncbi:MAG: hypothetical protein IPI12_03590 [Ignavibacteriales bacterium]|nr:hypothetical protein [Ignavibacteriales bacterium]
MDNERFWIPCNCRNQNDEGSTFGLTLVEKEEDLEQALNLLLNIPTMC